VTPAKVLAAARAVRTGRVFSLALPFDERGPQIGAVAGRFNPIRSMLATGTDALQTPNGPLGFGYADDMVTMPLQCGTQWDGLSHVFHNGRMYNGASAGLVSSRGAQRNGIEQVSSRFVTRGVLLDMPRALGPVASAPGHGYTAEELDAAAARHSVECGPGDVVIIRTGWMRPFLERGSWEGYADGDCPGLSHTSAEWFRAHDIVAVATDTYRVEVKPTQLVGSRSPFHILAITYMGMFLGELFNLEELADDCAADGVYEFMLVAPPLPFTGGVGSPINPYAIK
jgi:kynurenine formamidase